MTRFPLNFSEPLARLLKQRGFKPMFVVPSAIGLPADPGVTPEEWQQENDELRAAGELLLDELAI